MDQQCVQEARPGKTLERGRVPKDAGADLEEETLNRQNRSHLVTELHRLFLWSSSGPGRVRFFWQNGGDRIEAQPLRCYEH